MADRKRPTTAAEEEEGPKDDGLVPQPSSKHEEPYPFPSLQRDLFKCVSDGDGKELNKILAKSSTKLLFKDSSKIFDEKGSGILQVAVLHKRVEIMPQLLKAGLDINSVDRYCGTALHAAAYQNDDNTAGTLIDLKADVNVINEKGENVFEAACIGGNESLLRRLVPKLRYINMLCKNHGSLLQAAACIGKRNVVDDLISAGANVNLRGGLYGTALQAAAKGPNRQLPGLEDEHSGPSTPIDTYVEIAKILLKRGGDFMTTVRGGYFGNALNAAMFSESDTMFDLILENLPQSGRRSLEDLHGTSLTYAISKKDDPLPYVDKMVRKGFGVNCKAVGGSFHHPLDVASYYGHRNTINFLLEHEADLDAEGGRYGNALRAAVAAGKQDIAVYLVETKRASFESLDKKYGNLLQIAIFKGLEEVVWSLLEKDANLRVKDFKRRTVMHVAAWRGSPNIMKMILKKIHDSELLTELLNAKDAWGRTPYDEAKAAIKRSPPKDEYTRWAPDEVVMLLSEKVGDQREEQWYGEIITGPPVGKVFKEKMARPVFTAPFSNDRLDFQAAVVDFYLNGFETHRVRRLDIDSLLYNESLVYPGHVKVEQMEKQPPAYSQQKAAGQPAPDDPSPDSTGSNGEHRFRWIHLPANNMIWVEELINQIRVQKGLSTLGRELWGTGSESLSPSVMPHARRILPQCEVINSGTADADGSGFTFLATPYLHWEATKPQQDMAAVIKDVLEESSENADLGWPLMVRVTKLQLLQLITKLLNDYIGAYKQLPSSKDFISTTCKLYWSLFRRYIVLKYENRKLSTDTVRDQISGLDDALLKEYLSKDPPLHIRRTLDQYYYSWLDNTASRDRDQVILRHHVEERKSKLIQRSLNYQLVERTIEIINHEGDPEDILSKTFLTQSDVRNLEECIASFQTKKLSDPSSPILVVDQLWIWTFEGFVITSFPQRRHPSGNVDPDNRSDVLHAILHHLRNPNRAPIKRPQDLIEVIMWHCFTILNREPSQLPDLDFMRIFSVATNKAADDAMNLLTTFVSSFEKFRKQPDESEDSAIEFEKIFSVLTETHVFREVQDIQDELGMLESLFEEQFRLLKKAIKTFGAHQLNPHAIWDTSLRATLENIRRNQKDMSRMRNQAHQAYKMLKDLLNLKQQQANVLEARATRRQATSTSKQGETIMVFTVVTIIFLPLTFMTTVFQLNIVEYPRVTIPATSPTGSDIVGMKQSYVFGIVVGVTAAISIPLLLVAFNILKLKTAWHKCTEWGPIRRNFSPETEDKLPFLHRARDELENLDQDKYI